MEFGISLQSLLPLRAEAAHKSEMVSQVLFGELFRVLQKTKEWIRVKLAFDDYEGWIELKQVMLLDENEYIRLLNAETPVSMDLVQLLSNDTKQVIIPILLGSSLPGISDQRFTISGQQFSFEGLTTDTGLIQPLVTPQARLGSKQKLIDDAMLYLNAPYLWGGRSPFGIDCSGLVQMVYKLQKIRLLRDASQQATLGEPLNFISEAEPGDLAFFDNEEGIIVHVGIMMDKSRIIHASGKVRIDTIDHQGIYNAEEKRYTHKLRVMKRII